MVYKNELTVVSDAPGILPDEKPTNPLDCICENAKAELDACVLDLIPFSLPIQKYYFSNYI